jgi:hypothetical protein
VSSARLWSGSVLRLSALAWGLAGLGGCYAGVGYETGYDPDYPPAAFVATTEPVYVDGRAAYWYHDHWYYRDGGGWRHYDREPRVLYQRRVSAAPVRRNYEPGGWRGRPAPRSQGWRR